MLPGVHDRRKLPALRFEMDLTMATNSTIALELENGFIGQVNCLYDGDLEHNGRYLKNYWNDSKKLKQLILLGNLSTLRKEIGHAHDTVNPYKWGTEEYYQWKDQFKDWCTFLGRDKHETSIGPIWFNGLFSYGKNLIRKEYNYILRTTGIWYVSFYLTHNKFIQIDQAYELSHKEIF